MSTTKTICLGVVLGILWGYTNQPAQGDKPAKNILGTVTFEDSFDDPPVYFMQSDGGGTYPEKPPGGTSCLYLQWGAGNLNFDPGNKRSVLLHMRDAAVNPDWDSPDWEIPFDDGLAQVWMWVSGVGQSLASMQPGETIDARMGFQFFSDVHTRWAFGPIDSPDNPVAKVTASDTNGDGVTDKWEIRNPYGALLSGRKVDFVTTVSVPVGTFTFPFGLVFQTD